MVIYKDLQEMLNYLLLKHKSIKARSGAYLYKILRKPDGSRIPVEEMRGVRISNIAIYADKCVIVEHEAFGYKHEGVVSFTGHLYLQNICLINAYDYWAEFLTSNGLEIVYMEKNPDAQAVMLSDWVNDEKDSLRAQWFADDEIIKMLSEIGTHKKIQRHVDLGRNIEIDNLL